MMRDIMHRLKVMEQLGMDDDHSFGGWLTEDLKEHYKNLKEQRQHSELYSDRAELNNMMIIVLREIQSRERNS